MQNSEALNILRKRAQCKATVESCGCIIDDCDICECNVAENDVEGAIRTAVEALELMVSLEDDVK